MLKQLLLAFCFICSAWGASLEWNASVVDETHAAPTGYRIHRGTAPGVYDWSVDVGLALQWPIPDDLYGSYYWAASAYNEAGPSGYSNEVYWQRAPPQYIGATALIASRYQVGEQNMSAWYYAGGGNGASFTTEDWQDTERLLGGRITIGENGNITKLSFLSAQARDGDHYLYITDDDNNRLGCCAVANSGAGWMEATLSSAISVTASQVVRVYITLATGGDNSIGIFYKTSSDNGLYEYASYGSANICAQSSISPDVVGNDAYGVAVYVEASSGASAVPANRGNIGMMLGMSNSIWLDNDFLKPVGGN